MPGCVDDLDRHGTLRRGFQVVVDAGARRRVLRLRLVLLQGRPVVVPFDRRDRVAGLEEERVALRDVAARLTERGDPVDDPEAASERREDEIVAVDLQVAHRRDRQIELKRLPGVAVVERHEDGAFGAGEEQPGPLRILLDRVDVAVLRQASDDLLPRLAAVAGAINVRTEVLELMSIDGGIRLEEPGMRRFDHRHAAPRRHRGRRHVFPLAAVVERELNLTVVGADPHHRQQQRRRRDRVDDASLAVA
ncbi:MAG: hypothetical protein DMF86_17720, partial [Acidobacteria bacterium]